MKKIITTVVLCVVLASPAMANRGNERLVKLLANVELDVIKNLTYTVFYVIKQLTDAQFYTTINLTDEQLGLASKLAGEEYLDALRVIEEVIDNYWK